MIYHNANSKINVNILSKTEFHFAQIMSLSLCLILNAKKVFSLLYIFLSGAESTVCHI